MRAIDLVKQYSPAPYAEGLRLLIHSYMCVGDTFNQYNWVINDLDILRRNSFSRLHISRMLVFHPVLVDDRHQGIITLS